MHHDYIRAILHGENLGEVYSRLCRITNDLRNNEINCYQKELADARMIEAGLKQSKDSLAYQFSAQFLSDCKAAEEKKTDERKEFEARRQKVEEEYVKALEEQTAMIRRETDAIRQKAIQQEIENRRKQY